RPRPAGTHRPVGVLMARGPGIRKGIRSGELALLDVAPLLLYALGLPVPSDLEGRVPLELFDVAHRARNRVVTAAPAATNDRRGDGKRGYDNTQAEPQPAEGATYDDDGEATIMARLRSLGYIQ